MWGLVVVVVLVVVFSFNVLDYLFSPPIGSILWATHRFWEYVWEPYNTQPLLWLVCVTSISQILMAYKSKILFLTHRFAVWPWSFCSRLRVKCTCALAFLPILRNIHCLEHTFFTTEARSARCQAILIMEAHFECEGCHVCFYFLGQSKSQRQVQHQWHGKVYSLMEGVGERGYFLNNGKHRNPLQWDRV